MEPKKRSVGASERDEWLRAAWRVMLAARIDPERLVFVDEMGTNTSLSPIYDWAPKGRRAHCSVPRNRGKNTTLLSSMSLSGMGPSLAVDGPTDREVFEAYVERVLAPTLRAGQVLVMDNLSVHKGSAVRAAIAGAGCTPLYLPAYSPDLNPIELAFAKLKEALRRAGARTKETLLDALANALDAITAQDARGWFAACGFPLPAAQP